MLQVQFVAPIVSLARDGATITPCGPFVLADPVCLRDGVHYYSKRNWSAVMTTNATGLRPSNPSHQLILAADNHYDRANSRQTFTSQTTRP